MILEGIIVGLVLSLTIAIRYIFYFKDLKKEKSETIASLKCTIASLEYIIEAKSAIILNQEIQIQILKKFNG